MPWFPVDDDFAFNAKVRAAGNAAIGLWVRAGAYCMKQATDGILQRHELDGLGKPSEARRLVAVDLWHAVGHECPALCAQPPVGGWVFHEWHDNGPLKSAEQIKNRRAADRDRQRRHRAGNAGSHGVTDGVSNAERPPTPSPCPSPSVVQVPSQSRSATRAIDGLTDQQLEQLRRRLGCTEAHAAGVVIEVLSRAGAEVLDPFRYVLAAVDRETDRYRPTPGPPKKADCCPISGHESYPASNCGACRADLIAVDR